MLRFTLLAREGLLEEKEIKNSALGSASGGGVRLLRPGVEVEMALVAPATLQHEQLGKGVVLIGAHYHSGMLAFSVACFVPPRMYIYIG